jgi:hypothetical protein
MMMQPEALQPSALLDPFVPPARSTMPTLPFELEEYARWSCLPDADDELVFEAGPPLAAITNRVPRLSGRDDEETLTTLERLVLSLIDGVSPVSVLVQLAGPDPDAALVVVCDLFARGLLMLD